MTARVGRPPIAIASVPPQRRLLLDYSAPMVQALRPERTAGVDKARPGLGALSPSGFFRRTRRAEDRCRLAEMRDDYGSSANVRCMNRAWNPPEIEVRFQAA